MSCSATSEELLSHYRPWSDLPTDLLFNIAGRLTTVVDVASFSQVSPTWKVASYTNNHHPSTHFPCLLLSEKHPNPNYTRNFYHSDPKTGRREFLVIPEDMFCANRLSLSLPAACYQRCVGSGNGWIVMLNIHEQINMVSPLTGACSSLPPQSSLKFAAERHPGDNWVEEKYTAYISKIVVGKDKSGSNVVVAIAGVCKKLAIARPRDKKWTAVKGNWWQISDAIVHQGRIYAVTNKGTLLVCNLAGEAERMASPPKCKLSRVHKWYIVVSTSGSLLLVAREYVDRITTKDFIVFELLQEEGQWVPLKDLGDQALFVGFNTSTSVKASKISKCAANCVYFTDDNIQEYRYDKEYGGGFDTGEYCLSINYDSMSNPSVERYYVGESPYSPPLWYIPQLP